MTPLSRPLYRSIILRHMRETPNFARGGELVPPSVRAWLDVDEEIVGVYHNAAPGRHAPLVFTDVALYVVLDAPLPPRRIAWADVAGYAGPHDKYDPPGLYALVGGEVEFIPCAGGHGPRLRWRDAFSLGLLFHNLVPSVGGRFDWVCSDADGRIALFSTWGAHSLHSGLVPEDIALLRAMAVLLALPVSTSAVSMPAHRLEHQMAVVRGVYVFRGEPRTGPYALHAEPVVPLTLDQLPSRAARLVSQIQLRVRFSDLATIAPDAVLRAVASDSASAFV